ncbi:MAG TPA: choice-of-anchor J domain-containing protein, partial [Herpetosiphonaceae bacterium]
MLASFISLDPRSSRPACSWRRIIALLLIPLLLVRGGATAAARPQSGAGKAAAAQPPSACVATSLDTVSALPGAGWSLQNLSAPVGTTSWFQGDSTKFAAHSGSGYIAADYRNTSGTGNISNWLLTPVMSLSNGSTLSFWTRTIVEAREYPDRLELRLSTAGASTDVGSSATSVGDFGTLLLSINPTLTNSVYPRQWTQFTVTLSGLDAPTSGRFAFRYFVTSGGPSGSSSNYIGIDEMSYGLCPAADVSSPTL